MQFSCRNFGTLLSTSLRSFRMLEPNIFQKVAPDLARQIGERHNNHPCCQNDTKCHSWRDETELCRVRTAGWGSDADSGRVDGSGVHQHDRDAVLDRVDAAALAAPDEIKGVWLHLPNGLMAWFVRVHHWRKTSPETGVRSAEDQGQEKAAEPLALVDTIPLQFLETRYQPNPD